MKINLRRMNISEKEQILELLRKSFQYDYALHHPGATESEINDCLLPEFEDKYFEDDRYIPYVVLNETKRIVGCVVVIINEDQKNELEQLFFDPEQVSKGLGTMVWNEIEARYPNTKIWTTYTPYFSRRNIYFYLHKCGFMIKEIIDPRNDVWAFLKFEKIMPQH